MSVTVAAYLKAFVLTNLLEAPFYFWLLRKFSFYRQIAGLVVANFLTHPAVYFLWPWAFAQMHLSFSTYLAAAEGFAISIEVLFIWVTLRTPFRSTAVTLALANLFSWWLGVRLQIW